MRLDHLGDALDFAKGKVVKLVMPLLNGPMVVPMLTDQPDWGRRHFALYSEILGVPTRRILLRNQMFAAHQRVEYFRNVLERLHPYTAVFLDPDTGLRFRGGNPNNSVRRRDVAALLGACPSNRCLGKRSCYTAVCCR